MCTVQPAHDLLSGASLVELHGGTIEACSAGSDQGATFRVRLPLSSPPVLSTTSGSGPCPDNDIGHLRILLVEDHGITAKMMWQMLEGQGHEVEMAGDVASALESIASVISSTSAA